MMNNPAQLSVSVGVGALPAVASALAHAAANPTHDPILLLHVSVDRHEQSVKWVCHECRGSCTP